MFAARCHLQPYRRLRPGWQAPDLADCLIRFTVNRPDNSHRRLAFFADVDKVAATTRDAARKGEVFLMRKIVLAAATASLAIPVFPTVSQAEARGYKGRIWQD